MKRIQQFVTAALGVAMAVGLLSGCSSTYQARKAEPSGFLGDYSGMKKGGKEESLLLFIDPAADFRKYDKIMLDPVRIYATKDGDLAKLPKEDHQRLVNYLDAALRERLKKDYTIVNAPGPGVMRLRTAITEARGAKVALDTFSTLMPIGLAISEIKNLSTGSHTAVGAIGVECECLDAVSNARLFAAMDMRVGSKFTGKFDKFKKWRTAEDSFDYWADRLQARLKEERSKKDVK